MALWKAHYGISLPMYRLFLDRLKSPQPSLTFSTCPFVFPPGYAIVCFASIDPQYPHPSNDWSVNDICVGPI